MEVNSILIIRVIDLFKAFKEIKR